MSVTTPSLLCRWAHCQAAGPYPDTKALFEHLIHAHSPGAGGAQFCHWDGCKRASPVCGPQNRTRHFQLHAGYRPHRCATPGCGQSFYTEYDLKRHALEKCAVQVEAPEPAPQLGLSCRWAGCARAFTDDEAGAARLAAHLASEHCAASASALGCRWAECTRTPRSSFKDHVLSHLPEWYKPFACDECGEAFQKQNALTRHENVALQRGGCPKRRAAPVAEASNKRRKLVTEAGHEADTLPSSSPPPILSPSPPPVPVSSSSPLSSLPPPTAAISSSPPPYAGSAIEGEMTVASLHLRLLSAEKLIYEMHAEMEVLRQAMQDRTPPGERDDDFDWSLDD